jgi:anti-sigma B factor antagonist
MSDFAAMLGAARFRIGEEQVAAGVIVLTLHGDADFHVVPVLRQRLHTAIEGGRFAVVLDLSDVAFVDSTTLGVMLGARKQARARGGDLRLVVPQTDVRRILELTQLDRVLTIDPSRDAALAALGAESGRRA